MTTKTYKKLVRDDIPKVIEASNKKCKTELAEGEELKQLLDQKLQEEVQEYLESSGTEELEELADILEVIYGILHSRNITIEELENIRLKKKEERGGFTKGIKLLEVY